jgi:site-specific recombinase XerD
MCNVVKKYIDKSGKIREYIETTSKLRYHIPKWFEDVIPDSINPYYLRHNRFSKMSLKGASVQDIKNMKGAKSIASAEYYIHMNTKKAKQLARMND